MDITEESRNKPLTLTDNLGHNNEETVFKKWCSNRIVHAK